MSSKPYYIRLFILVLVCANFGGGAIEAQARDHHTSGRLIVQRSPDFGSNLVIRLSIDGERVANIPRDHRYDGFVPAGPHVLTLLALPNSPFRRPGSTRVIIQPGRTHLLTAGWDADRLVLRPSSYSNEATQAPSAQ